MPEEPDALELIEGAHRTGRARLSLRNELLLALFPTLTVFLVLWTGDRLAGRHILFAALASSAFLIYLDPMHATNSLPVLTSSHLFGALFGMGAGWVLGNTSTAAALAVMVTILVMVIGNIMHPPAIGTSLSFAFHAGLDANLTLFLLALGMVALLAIMQRVLQYLLMRLDQS